MQNGERMPSIEGTNLSPEDRNAIHEMFAKDREHGREPFEGETDKSETDRRFIVFMNAAILDELRSLDIDDAAAIAPEQIHLLSREGFQAYAKTHVDNELEPDTAGLHAHRTDAVIVNRDAGTPLQVYRALFHESVHAASLHRFRFNLQTLKLQERVGYTITHRDNGIPIEQKLVGYNEAMTEKITRELMSARKNEIVELLGLTAEDQDVAIFTYDEERDILETIIAGVTAAKHEDPDIVWRRMKTGYFQGDMMHLRDIERTYGTGALQVLSLLHGSTGTMTKKETQDKILEFFEAPDDGARTRIQQELFRPSESS